VNRRESRTLRKRRAARALTEAELPTRAQSVGFPIAKQAMDGAQEAERAGTPADAPQERRTLAKRKDALVAVDIARVERARRCWRGRSRAPRWTHRRCAINSALCLRPPIAP